MEVLQQVIVEAESKYVGFVMVRNCMATGIVAFRELSFIADVCFRIVLEKSSFY
jgi:hypothetical protein